MRPDACFWWLLALAAAVSFPGRTPPILAATAVGVRGSIDPCEVGSDALEIRAGARHGDKYTEAGSLLRVGGYTTGWLRCWSNERS